MTTTWATLAPTPERRPTPRRTWKLKDASYSLRRGKSAEILDVYPNHLDGDFEGYFSGSDGRIAPWNAVVRRWKPTTDATWHPVSS